MRVSEQDTVEKEVRQQLAEDGINLDELLNAGKVLSLTRKLQQLQIQSTALQQGSDAYCTAEAKIKSIQADLVREKRQVMQTWLKRLFLFQAYAFLGLGALLSFDAIPTISVPIVGQALGFWIVWLFTVPALRARKGISKSEKSALNISFLLIPFVNLSLPFITKNCGLIWTADTTLLAACYLYYYALAAFSVASTNENAQPLKEQAAIKGILKYLDWGSWR